MIMKTSEIYTIYNSLLYDNTDNKTNIHLSKKKNKK